MLEVLSSGRRRLRRGTRAFRHEVDVGFARIFVDHGFQWDGSHNVWLTRARASFVLGAGPAFRLRPRGLFERLLGWHPGKPSGDPCIDDFFVAYSDNASSTWSALTLRARSLLARSFEDARLVSDGQLVTLWREGDFGREADARVAAELVGEVVGFRSEIVECLRQLPGAVFRRPTGSWENRLAPSVLLHMPAPVVIGPTPTPLGATLAASSPCAGNAPRFDIDFGDQDTVLAACRQIGAELAAVSRLKASRLTCDGRNVTLVWPGLDVDRERILGGARWVAELARTEHRSVYR